MSEAVIAPTFLFRFAVPLRRCEPIWSAAGLELDDSHLLPSLGELEGRSPFASLRAAWSDAGLTFVLRVEGKAQPAWCRAARPEDSDGLQLWIDTRDTHNVHRASRFCHQFVFLPFGGGRSQNEPFATLLPINRARENPRPIPPGTLKALSQQLADGYVLQAHLPAAALTGFDPGEHPRLGFTYAVRDREKGLQSFHVAQEFPFSEDPSLWSTLELSR